MALIICRNFLTIFYTRHAETFSSFYIMRNMGLKSLQMYSYEILDTYISI